MATCYYQIIYKGDAADICIDFPDSGFTNLHATFYTDGENVAMPDYYDYEDGELTFHFSPDDFELVNDGVIRYIIEYQVDGEDITLSTNANAYLKTPAYFSGHTDEEYWESGYTSGYTDGYDSGYTDGEESVDCTPFYESGFTEGYDSGFTDGQESVDCTPFYESGYTDGWKEGYPSGYTDGYSSGYTDGADSVDCTEAYQSGITEGIREQKSKLTALTANTNMIYEREDGYRRVVVSVPQTGHTDAEMQEAYESGYTNGQESVDCTPYWESGYTSGSTDGWDSGYPSGYTDGYGSGFTDGADSVDCTPFYESGYTSGHTDGYGDGEAAQKAKLTATTFTVNGNYTRVDGGWSSVTVNVAQTGYTQEDIDNAFNSGWTNGYDSGYSDGSSSCLIYVQDLIDEGYANVITGANGTYIDILSGCPYNASQIVDLKEVATNTKKLSGTTDNVIVWDQPKATGFSDTDIASLYSGETLNFTPRGGLLWGLGNIDNFSITFASGSWIAADYPWGSYHSEGVFAPRYDAVNEPYYSSAGFRNTPKNLTVTIDGGYSTVGQVMFTMMKTTTAFTLNVNGFDCHDVTGMFEADTDLQTLNINGRFYWSSFRTMHNLFDGCNSLTGIPINSDLSRDHNYNTIYPHNDGVRGSANCRNIFRNCNSLTYLGPTFNMNAISLSGCVVDNINQEALAGTLFGCPLLSDVHIINLNNNDWNFADGSTYTYIPAMNAASIEYLLNNVADVTSQGGHTVTFADTYKNNVSASAITYAQSMGWNVVFGNEHDYSKDYLTFEIISSGIIYWMGTQESLAPEAAAKNIYYSKDNGETWSELAYGNAINVNSGDKVQFKGSGTSYQNNSFNGSTSIFKVYGNILSLATEDFASLTSYTMYYNMFSGLFKQTKVVDASNLILKYANGFGCYGGLFNGCSWLTVAPELPATQLSAYCYSMMFEECNSLIVAPELPATVLYDYCYTEMFKGCTSLTTSPVLCATTLGEFSYGFMFQGCSSLSAVTCLATNISAVGCTQSWLYNVSASGTFTKAASMSSWTTGDSGIPNGWTVIDAS